MDYFKLMRSKSKKAATTVAEKAKPSTETTTSKPEDSSHEPVLTAEDEDFLRRMAEEGTPPPLPERHPILDLPEAGSQQTNNAQIALMNGAQDLPLPDTPTEETETQDTKTDKDKSKEKDNGPKKTSRFGSIFRKSSSQQRTTAANDLQSAATELKNPSTSESATQPTVAEIEAAKEEAEMAQVMEQLNLAASNNRVFSISDESRELLKRFNLVLQDLVKGVPTAYGDLEALLTNSEDTLKKTHSALPPFLQSLVEKLPSRFSDKFTESVGPEVLAAAAKKHGIESELLGKGAESASKMGVKVKVPSLKELVTKQGAIASLLRAIVGFLKQRFPMLLGVNAIWSMALFVLLLIFWYCHKRGREVRLEQERLLTAEEMEALRAQVEAEEPGTYTPSADTNPSSPISSTEASTTLNSTNPANLSSTNPSQTSTALVLASSDLTTTAPPGASIEEVREGIREAAIARENAAREAAGITAEGYAEGGALANALREEGKEGDDGKGKGKEKEKEKVQE